MSPEYSEATGGKGAETIWAEAGMGGATTTGLGTGAGGSGWYSDPINQSLEVVLIKFE